MPKLKTFILEQIIPGFHAARSNKTISKLNNDRANFDVDIASVAGNEREYIEQLKTELKEQHDRKKTIEDKAKSLLFIITASIATITFSLTYLNSISMTNFQIVALVFLGVSILYFIAAVIRVLQTLNIRQFHVVHAEIETTETNYKLLSKKADNEFLKDLIKSKQQNDLINLCLSNYTFASFNLIRNGIILFAVFFVTSIGGGVFAQKNKTTNVYPINKEIQIKINDSIDLKMICPRFHGQFKRLI